MKIIRNKIIPFQGYKAINLFGILFTRSKAVLSDVFINHEAIHSAQMKELLWIPFYIWYIIEYIIRLFCYKFDTDKAYRQIWFEQEAYKYEKDLDYLKNRKCYAEFRE